MTKTSRIRSPLDGASGPPDTSPRAPDRVPGPAAQHRRAAEHGRAGRHGRAHGRAVPAALPAGPGRRVPLRRASSTAWTTCWARSTRSPAATCPTGSGTKRALLVFNLVSMAGFLIVILVPSWPAVLAAAALFLSWTAISLPATMSLVARVLPKNKRTMGVSVHSLVRRVPMALGPVVGGVFIGVWGVELGVRLAFVGALVMAVVAADPAAAADRGRPAPRRHEARRRAQPAAAVAVHERRPAQPAGQRHPGALLRADPLRLRGHLGGGDRAEPGPGHAPCSSACCAASRWPPPS